MLTMTQIIAIIMIVVMVSSMIIAVVYEYRSRAKLDIVLKRPRITARIRKRLTIDEENEFIIYLKGHAWQWDMGIDWIYNRWMERRSPMSPLGYQYCVPYDATTGGFPPVMSFDNADKKRKELLCVI